MSKIEWTHRPGTKSEVWNMIRGCSLVSAGCTNCYAMHFAHRFSQPGGPFEGLTKMTNSGVKWTGKIKLMHDMLMIPLKWRTPRTCFVNSMTDLFHEDVPFDFIDQVFAVMRICSQHTFIILTKRAEQMAEYYKRNVPKYIDDALLKMMQDDGTIKSQPCLVQNDGIEGWPLKNVWMLVSAEDQQTYDDRVKHLMQIPAAVRGVSIEPQIGPINMFSRFESNEYNNFWILNGGESGHKARVPHPDWFRTIRDQCKYASIPYFFKQWGQYIPSYQAGEKADEVANYNKTFGERWAHKSVTLADGLQMVKVGKHASGNHLDGVQHLEFPEDRWRRKFYKV